MKDLFDDVVIQDNKEKMTPHQRKCLYCHKWFETTSNYASRCPDHLDKPERKKIEINDNNPNSLPF